MKVYIDEAMEWVDVKVFAEWWVDWLLEPPYWSAP